MTFELSSEQQSLQARARALAAEHIRPVAEAIDRDAAIAANLLAEIERAKLVHASAGVAYASGAAGALWTEGGDAQLPGLRGLGALDEQLRTLAPAAVTRVRIVLAAVAVGIGRAALDEALAAMRASGDRPSGDPDERPHWVLADAATEVDAARLLTQKAAQALDRGQGEAEASLAKVFAADVAGRAVEAALRILGPGGYRRGTVTERLTRDARAIALLGGTAEEQRAIVADLTLPASRV
jgi:alkylation response protein AidB-like acyl-CoA dehydrogenase